MELPSLDNLREIVLVGLSVPQNLLQEQFAKLHSAAFRRHVESADLKDLAAFVIASVSEAASSFRTISPANWSLS
jgi:hypothetical protein